jgi:DNA invertase Pin-like site-specific DNA recombinase
MEQIKKDKKIYHAAIYVRLSKEDGDVESSGKRESNSISNQKDLIKNFLKDKEDIVVVSERVDDGYSGSNFERPAFQMMMDDIKKGIVDCVVVKDLSRFGREYIDAGKYIERIFPSLGVRFIAINDNYDSIEGKSQADEIVIPFKNLINDAYCRDISIKIRSHLEVKRKNGEYIGAFTPYGYKKDEVDRHKLVVDTYAAGIVKEIFRMKLSGMSQTAIANNLNAQGVLSPMEYKHSIGIQIQDNFKRHEQAEWSAMSVRRVLENEVYVGTLIQGKHTTPNHKVKKIMEKPQKDWVRIEQNHEAIVTKREFDLVQRLLGLDTRTSPSEEKVYPLSGIAVCGDCGALMVKRDVPAGGKVYSYYICSRNAATKECSTHRIPMVKLEETVLELLKIHIENVLDMKRILDYINIVPFQELDIKELENRKEAMEKEIERCRELRDYLYEDFREGIISKDDYAELYDGYTEKRKKSEEAVRNIERQITEILESKSDKYQWLDYFTEHQNINALTRTVAVELIDQVKVYDKKNIEVIFSFDDCYNTLLGQMSAVGCEVSIGDNGRISVERKEVV